MGEGKVKLLKKKTKMGSIAYGMIETGFLIPQLLLDKLQI
jgi:hypothetical protein